MSENIELNDFQKAFRENEMRANREALMSNDDEDFVDEDTQTGRYMTFCCDGDYYGIAITYVSEIIGIPQITELPETVEYIRGLINLRGRIVPVIDVRLRFKKEFREYNDRTCAIVVTVGDDTVGLIVDTIADVVNIPKSDILTPRANKNQDTNHYVFGIGKVGNEVKLLIDPEKLIKDTLAVNGNT